MSGQQVKPVTYGGMRGRDGSKTSVGILPEHGGIPMDRFSAAVNVDLYRTTFARKRYGSTAQNLGFASGGPFASGIKTLGVTRSPSTGFERLWAIDGSGQLAYADEIGTNKWNELALTDTFTASVMSDSQFVQFEGYTYITAENSASPTRILVYDGTSVRRAGMGTPSSPTVANTGAGAYAATLRYYKVRMAVLSGSNVVRMGEASASQSFTPSGAGTAARVTKPTTVEDATHWRVEVSLDDAVYYVLSAWIVVGTTTYDDSAVTTTYSSNDAAPLVGEFTTWRHQDFLVAGEGRLIGLTRAGRLSYSAVVGTTSSTFLDHERVPDTVERKFYLQLETDQPTIQSGSGLAWWNNAIWAFQTRAIHQYVHTGLPNAPFRRARSYSGAGYGTRSHRSIVKAKDEFGQPALYWMSDLGPCRMTVSGMQFLFRDIEDIIKTLWLADENNTVGFPVEHTAWVPSLGQVWFWAATLAGSGAIDTLMVFDVSKGRMENGEIRGGWTVFTGAIAAAVYSTVASLTLDGRPMTSYPFVGTESGTTILYYDPTATQDNGVSFQGYVDIPERPYGGMTHRCAVTGAEVACVGGSNVDLRLTISRDQGADSRNCDVSIASGVVRGKFADAEMGDADTLKFRIGDSAAATDVWTIDALTVAVERREQRVP